MKKLFTFVSLLFFFILPACHTCSIKAENDEGRYEMNIPNPPPSRFDEAVFPNDNAPTETEKDERKDAPNEHTPAPLPLRWDVSDIDISYVSRERKLIAFTFDDAPSHELENLLAVFASYNEANPDCKATATVFCNGYFFDKQNAHTLNAALTMGWELGNHSYSHPDLTTLDEDTLQKEIAKTDELLSKFDGKRVHLFRPPYGRFDEKVRATCPAPIINWTIDTLDWSGTSTEEIVEQVLSQKADGSIVLMHDNCPNTVDALKILLPKLKEEGYQAVSVSTLAKMHERTLKPHGVYIRVRKNGNE